MVQSFFTLIPLWMDEWMDGWMDGWTDEHANTAYCELFCWYRFVYALT